MADLKISQLAALAQGDLAATDAVPVVDTSGAETKKITPTAMVAGAIDLLSDGTIDGNKIEAGTTSARGTVQLTDSTTSTSTTTAATPAAVKVAKDAADAAQSTANAALPKAGGTMTGPLVTPAGTVTANGIQVGTGTTYKPGIYSPGADQLAISTNGTGRITVDGSGNVNIDSNTLYVDAVNNRVGIGTPGPSNTLSVDSANAVPVQVFSTQATHYLQLTSDSGGTAKSAGIFTNNDALGFFTSSSGTERARITSTGALNFVGAGTAGSTQAVSFNGSAPVNSLVIDSSGRLGIGTSAPKIELQAGASGGIQAASALELAIRYNLYNSSGDKYIQASNKASSIVMNSDGDFIFYNTNTASTAADSAVTGLAARMTIKASGNVGIGTTSPTQKVQITDGTLSNFYIAPGYNSGSGTLLATGGSEYLAFATNGLTNERARIDSSGRLLVGTSTDQGNSILQVQGEAGAATAAGVLYLRRGLNTAAIGANVGADLGKIQWGANDGTIGAWIQCLSDATWSSTSDTPSALVFSTTPDGGSSPSPRMTIANDGFVTIGVSTMTSNSALFVRVNGNRVAAFDRQGSDGTIVELRQDDVVEGTISVSGTTVSYNGAHLSRWSQLPGGAERTEILRGSVLSNIDEMCEWGEQDNEQLNRMKVSDVEGDKNVSGVFQAWDDDDDTYTDDFYCAMTGDFIIRIAEGITVERGDLLMSAGDGTAKPQDDDIIRSKTIAKVTSTNVSCTYEDGSYCVPCVLMAC